MGKPLFAYLKAAVHICFEHYQSPAYIVARIYIAVLIRPGVLTHKGNLCKGYSEIKKMKVYL